MVLPSGWWDEDWTYRKKITNDTAGPFSAYESGKHYLRLPVNLVALQASGKCNAGYDDVRIVRQYSTSFEELPRYIASGVSPARIYFPCNQNIPSGTNLGTTETVSYYMYYGNNSPATQPLSWVNLNCPQAPFSPVAYGDRTASGYYDKFFLRMNDASGPFIQDSSDHFTGNNSPSGFGVTYGHPGRLDSCIHFTSAAKNFIKIPGSHFLNPSGKWFWDCWYRPEVFDTAYHYLMTRVSAAGPLPAEKFSILLKGTTAPQNGSYWLYENGNGLQQNPAPTSALGKWVYLRGMSYDTPDVIEGFMVGSGATAGLVRRQKANTVTPATTNDSWPIFIGNYVGTNNVENMNLYRFKGFIEQMRFGTWMGDNAPSGINKWWTDPYYVKSEYILNLAAEEAPPAPPVIPPTDVPATYVGGYMSAGYYPTHPDRQKLGGYLLSKVLTGHQNYAMVGGLARAVILICSTAVIGGYISTVVVSDVPGSYIGAYENARYVKDAIAGGFMWGQPANTEYAESHARTLVKANSKDVINQEINIDGQVTFKGLGAKDFNATFTMMNTDKAEFAGKINIQKYRRAPTVTITSVTPQTSILTNGVCQVTVSATGSFGDGTEWKHAYIDFGEPYTNDTAIHFNEDASISGFTTNPVWSATHDYHASGVYNIVARAIDENGCIGSDIAILNLASGLVAGVDYPKLDIGATPRSGYVPDPLLVDFHVHCSGTSLNYPADNRILWNFGNLESSHLQNPSTYYAAPGLYAPTIRLQYRNANGDVIWVADSLLLGWGN